MLVTRNAHQAGHPGIATTTAKVKRKYYGAVKGNKMFKVVKRQCVFCRVIEGKAKTRLMAKLPSYHLKPFTPRFMYTSCDYFGPIKIKVGRNKTAKNYGVLFTCLNSRTIHCELATDASTMEFLQVLRRFYSYSGYPKVMISDNGSQMVGTEREIRLMIEGLDKNKLKGF